MLKELYNAIRDDAASKRPEFAHDLEGRAVVVSDSGVSKWDDPRFPGITLQTLSGLVDYCKANLDKLELKTKAMVHVFCHNRVELKSISQGDWLYRDVYVSAIFDAPQQFSFGRWLDQEDFVIEAQAKFVDDADRERVLKLVASITTGATTTVADDGVSQTVMTKAGVSLKGKIQVENPFNLKPYRTFHEAMQPSSPFILRVRQSGDSVAVALFEADGGAWKNDAIACVSYYLKHRLPEGMTVIA